MTGFGTAEFVVASYTMFNIGLLQGKHTELIT